MAEAPHAAARRVLSAAMSAGRLPRSLLVTGEAGIGKLAFAEWLARRRWCAAAEPPCGVCPTCRKVSTGNHPDYLVVRRDAEGTGGSGSRHEITVDQVRQEILPLLGLRAVEGQGRTVVLVDADDLNVEAQNALLKTLEEPPEASLLLLVTSREDALLDTIRSRCQEVRLFPEQTGTHMVWGWRRHAAEQLQALGPEAVFDALDLLLQGRSGPGAFASRVGELTDGGDGDSTERVRLALDLLQLRLRDLALWRAGGRAEQLSTPVPVDAADLPGPEALIQAADALSEAVQDVRRHLPTHVMWLALGRKIAPV